jgi:hypothetical protein
VGQHGRQGDLDAQSLLPARPLRPLGQRVLQGNRLGQGGQERVQFAFEPGVQNGIGAAGDAFDPHLPRRGTKQRQQFHGSQTEVLVRLPPGMRLRLPAVAGIGHGLIRARFILTGDGHPARLRLAVRLLNQLFFASASGSVTCTRPRLRRRTA